MTDLTTSATAYQDPDNSLASIDEQVDHAMAELLSDVANAAEAAALRTCIRAVITGTPAALRLLSPRTIYDAYHAYYSDADNYEIAEYVTAESFRRGELEVKRG